MRRLLENPERAKGQQHLIRELTAHPEYGVEFVEQQSPSRERCFSTQFSFMIFGIGALLTSFVGLSTASSVMSRFCSVSIA